MKTNCKKKFGMSAEMKENSKDKGTTEIFSNSKTVSTGKKKKKAKETFEITLRNNRL